MLAPVPGDRVKHRCGHSPSAPASAPSWLRAALFSHALLRTDAHTLEAGHG